MHHSIIEKLLYLEKNKPNHIAYHFLEGETTLTITYHELLAKVHSIAQKIRLHAKPGDRALLVYPPGMDYIVAFYACLLANVIAVPVYPPATKELIEKLQHVIMDASPSLVLTSKSITDQIKKLFLLKKINKVPLLRKWLSTRLKNKVSYDWDFDKLYWLPTDELIATEPFSGEYLPNAEDIAFLQYTSGSTGNPKGVMVTHGNIMSNLELQKKGFGLNEEDILAHWLPPYHDMGLVGAIMQPIFLGQKGILMSPVQFIKKPVNWLKMISDYQATVSGAPNFAYSLCNTTITPKEMEEIDLSSWRNAFCGAEPINKNVLRAFASRFSAYGFDEKAFFPCYGLAEATLFVSGGYYDLDRNEEKVDCGVIYQNMAVVNPETHQECGPDEVGEIWLSGPSITKGYWQKDALNKELFQAKIAGRKELFFRTGDLGYQHNNHLYPTGRIKDLIIINGKNYYPSDIEEFILENYPQIRKGSCAAFSITSEDTEKLIVVAQINKQITKNEQKLLAVEMYQAIMAKWQIESSDIILISAGRLPKTTSGKLRRFKVKQDYLDKTLPISFSLLDFKNAEVITTHTDDLPPPTESTPIDNQICRIRKLVEKSLGLGRDIDISRPLTEYGLNSIKAIELTGFLEKEFQREINVSVLYNYPSIIQLAGYLSPQNKDNKSVPLQPADNHLTDIAVIGMSCRLPGNVNNPEEFWNFLLNKSNGISTTPEDRWDIDHFYSEHNEPGKINTQYGGFINHVDHFDESFFNITPNEAKHIDPQQRLALQEVWHAFENAGLTPNSLAQHQVGVFIGASNNDYADLLREQGDTAISAYYGLGNALSAIAGRIAYAFGLHGPCMTVDTACSSSLAAVHQAANSLKHGECTLALAGGINLMLTPKLSIALSQAHMLSPDGSCKSFSDKANGYVRSEGLGFVLLKPLAEAIKDGNQILAVIKGSSMNQDGTSNGLSAPNGLAQEKLINDALLQAKLRPDDIGYLESHGTGTKLGDPIEIDAINSVFAMQKHVREPLVIGALKSNIGHLEAAAGIAGLIKTILILKHKIIPANLHCDRINPHINIEKTPLVFPQQNLQWEKKNKKYYAGVSSFGFTGTNVHVILSDYQAPPKTAKESPSSLLCISAKNEYSLNQLKSTYIALLKEPAVHLESLCTHSALQREHFKLRIACYASNKEEMVEKLEQCTLNPNEANKGKIVFLFTGQGSQYTDMAKVLYECCPVFKDQIDHCDALIKKHTSLSIINHFISSNPFSEHSANVQLLIFAVEYALAKMWQSWGTNPDYVAGHSLGTYAAASFSGILKLGDAIELLSLRANLMEKTQGKTLALITSMQEVNELLAINPDAEINIAAINSAHQILVAGDGGAVDELNELAKERGIRTRIISAHNAFHSSQMDPILDEFNRKAKTIKYYGAQIPLVEDLSGQVVKTLDSEFFTRQIRNTIDFISVANTLTQCHCTLFIEMGPQPILSGFIEARSDKPKLVLPTLRKNKNDWAQCCHVLQILYLNDYPIEWSAVYKDYPFKETFIPYYPFTPNIHWVNKESLNKTQSLPVLTSEEPVSPPHKDPEKLWMELPLDERNLYLEQLITREIRYVGGMDANSPIHVEDNFFEMGIDSLMIVQLINNVNRSIKAANILITPEKVTQPSISAVIVLINQTLEEQRLSLKD